MDTSRTHLIARLCLAVLVGWLVVLAAACTATSTPSAPTTSSPREPGPRDSGIDLWRSRNTVSLGYLNGTWATGELSRHHAPAALGRGWSRPMCIGRRRRARRPPPDPVRKWRQLVADQDRRARVRSLDGRRLPRDSDRPDSCRCVVLQDRGERILGKRIANARWIELQHQGYADASARRKTVVHHCGRSDRVVSDALYESAEVR